MNIPLLSQIFEPPNAGDAPAMTMGNLAVALNVPLSRLEPLALHGWIKLRSAGPITSKSLITSPTEAAISWLRQWFQPVFAKPMFSRLDVAQLLDIDAKDVLELAAAHDVPVIYDPAMGHMFSVWATRNLLKKVLSGGREDSIRFDRIAMLWHLMEGDPQRVAEIPRFDEKLEQEIARVAQLAEPMRSTRSMALVSQFQDARAVLGACDSPCEPLVEACEKKLSTLA